MAAGRSIPLHADIPGFDIQEMIYESGPRAIFRAKRTDTQADVAIKTLKAAYPPREEIAGIRREYQIAEKLSIDGVIDVRSLVPHGNGNLAIEMELYGISLAEMLFRRDSRPLPLAQFFEIAVSVSTILGRLHEQNVVHKDVVPRNVLIDPDTRELRLIDFGISSELSRERQNINISNRLEGSLPYISPEQTGRMNRDLDYRSDYYSLGVTFFELLTGKLPFAANDALEWVHKHISQPAPSATSVNPEVPEPVSRIVSKLMEKNAEDRYQSTFGLIMDL